MCSHAASCAALGRPGASSHRGAQHGRTSVCPTGGAIMLVLLQIASMAGIHITDIEAAINYWRERKPSPDGITLAPELRALAEVYALLVYYHEDEADEFTLPLKAKDAWLTWYATMPDTPCRCTSRVIGPPLIVASGRGPAPKAPKYYVGPNPTNTVRAIAIAIPL